MANVLFKDLKRFVDNHQQQSIQKGLFDRLRYKEFWLWNKKEHMQEHARTEGDCCFNHILGLPIKDGEEKHMFDYEKMLYDALMSDESHNPLNRAFKHKHL